MSPLDAFILDLKRKRLTFELKLAQDSFDYWQARENEDRANHNANLVRFSRKHRKAAKADVDYWRSQLESLYA